MIDEMIPLPLLNWFLISVDYVQYQRKELSCFMRLTLASVNGRCMYNRLL